MFLMKHKTVFHVKTRLTQTILFRVQKISTNMAKHNQIGKLCEDIAIKHLSKKGYKLLDRNYSTKTGEIDIITIKNDKLVFFEVKSVSCENITDAPRIRPEENLHHHKLQRLYRTIDMYLTYKNFRDETWILLLITVKICLSDKKAEVDIISVL